MTVSRPAIWACAAVLAAVAGGAHAQTLGSYFLNLTENSTGLSVSTNLPTYDSFPDDSFQPDQVPGAPDQTWYFGPTYGGYKEFGMNSTDPDSDAYYAISWIDPNGDGYNVLQISPSGNRGNENFAALGDVPAAEQPGDVYNACFGPDGHFACPVLKDGATFTSPISLYGTPLGTLSITFTDQSEPGGDAVPEPAAWALMITGFGLAGATLRARRWMAA